MGGTVAEGVAEGRGVRVGLGVGDSVGVGLVVGSGEIVGVEVSITREGITAVGGKVGSGARNSSKGAHPVRMNKRKAIMMIFLCIVK